MAWETHHTTSHDLAAQSPAKWHQCSGGWSSHANSSKILHGVFESSLCAHHAPGQPCQRLEFSVPEQWANRSFKVSPRRAVPTEVPSLSEHSKLRALLIQYFVENIIICAIKKATDDIFHFISNIPPNVASISRLHVNSLYITNLQNNACIKVC